MMAGTALYRGVISQLERRRSEIGLSVEQMDHTAGTPAGYYAKCVGTDGQPSRPGRWERLQLVIDALFPDGVQVTIEAENENALLSAVRIAEPSERLSAISLANARKTRHWRHTKHFRELGAKGGRAYAEKVSPRRRSAIARRGARARWRRWRAKQAQQSEKGLKRTDWPQQGSAGAVALLR
jgi:hypothetical protein